MNKAHIQSTVGGLVLVAAGIGIGYFIWSPDDLLVTRTEDTATTTTDQSGEPEEPPREQEPPGAPEVRPVGWFDQGSDDRRADAAIFSNSQDHVLVIACNVDRVDNPRVGMTFRYDPFPVQNVGYTSTERWTFYTGTQPGLSGDFTVKLTTEHADALLSAETLIYEAHADPQPDPAADPAALETSLEGGRWEGETEWQHPPAVYLHRGVFDLSINRDVLAAVLYRCGPQLEEPR